MPHIELIARGLLIRDRQILLCQNKLKGYWYLPGGHVEFGESAPDSLAREFQEEARLAVRVRDLAFVVEGAFNTGPTRHHELNLVFHVELSGQVNHVVSAEADIAFNWHGLETLSRLDLRPSAIRQWLVTTDQATIWLSAMGA